ncbi:MAG: hypothetical protein ACI9GO_000382 [Bacteroidia bacterium]|jgi:hypothetical protein
MRKAILILGLSLLLFAVHPANAQMVTVKEKPSFYLGKRFTADLSLKYQLTNAPQKPFEKYEERDRLVNLYFHINPEVKFNYALSNKVALYAKLGATRTSHQPEYDGFNSYLQTDLSGNSLGLGFSFFKKKKGAIAPVGRYFSFGLSRHSYTLTPGVIIRSQSKTVEESSESFSIPLRNYSFDLEFGTKNLITSKVYYNFSFQLTGNFGTSQVVRTIEDEGYEDLGFVIGNRIRIKDLALFKIGLGYVVF